MTSHKLRRYTMFGLLYFVQGTVLSYFTALNPIYLLNNEVSISQVGIMGAIAMIPFVIKIFFGMLSDRVNFFKLGYRRPYIIIGLLIQFLCLILVPFIHPGKQFDLFVLLAFITQAGMALYDTCTDGLALDTTSKEEEGTVQGIMVGGRALGVVIISAILGLLVKNLSWQAMFWSLAGLSLLPIPFVILTREAPRAAGKRFEWKAFGAFRTAPIISLALLGALYSMVTNGANQLITPFLNLNFGVDEFGAGLYISMWGLGVVVGGLTGGRLVDKVSQRRAVQIALTLSLLAIASLAAITNTNVAWILIFLFGLAYGYYETVYFALSMDRSDPRIAASMFSILMAVANIGTGIGLAISGALAENAGYQTAFAVMAVLNLLALPLLPIIFKKGATK